jgi:hypothetical protein
MKEKLELERLYYVKYKDHVAQIGDTNFPINIIKATPFKPVLVENTGYLVYDGEDFIQLALTKWISQEEDSPFLVGYDKITYGDNQAILKCCIINIVPINLDDQV